MKMSKSVVREFRKVGVVGGGGAALGEGAKKADHDAAACVVRIKKKFVKKGERENNRE